MICMQRRHSACVRILPRSHRSHYVLDIRAKTAARSRSFPSCKHYRRNDAIICRLLTSYLYDRTRRKDVHGVLENQTPLNTATARAKALAEVDQGITGEALSEANSAPL